MQVKLFVLLTFSGLLNIARRGKSRAAKEADRVDDQEKGAGAGEVKYIFIRIAESSSLFSAAFFNIKLAQRWH